MGPETQPLCISTCCVFNLNTVSILRSICGDGKIQENRELYKGRGISEKCTNIKRYSWGGMELEMGLGDVALDRSGSEGSTF